MTSPLRLGFLQDPSGDNEWERKAATREMSRFTGHPYEVLWVGTEQDLASAPDSIDLLLVDYGGLHSSYSGAWHRYGQAVKKWADEHPGKPVVLWTAFTAACYKASFDDFAEHGNVLMRYGDAWDFVGVPGFAEALRAWLGDVRAHAGG